MSAASPPRLSNETLTRLPPDIRRPQYDRSRLTPGIVHLGIGAFHRAHQAVYTDDVLPRDPGWGILGVSLRSPDTRDALAPQDHLYTEALLSGGGEKLRIIGSVTEVLVAPEGVGAVLAAMSDPHIKIVSLTITEKGYCHDPATGTLNETHPDIVHDLANPQAPRSAPGLSVAALKRRRAAGTPPFTVLTCDNLPSNGRVVKRVLSRFAELADRDFGAFVAGELACPSTMVDRIVPATTDEDRARIGEKLGARDAWPVVAEPYWQWVIEDDFPTGRPAWEEAGAEPVADVEPHELLKLRLLNGAHSSLAYLGYLAGYETIAGTMADPAFAAFARGQMDEVTPTLIVPPGIDVEGRKAALCERFKNPALKHRTWQIAMDGSQKLPQRLLAPARDLLKRGAPIDHLALGVAAWMRYVTGTDENGRPIDVRDPLAPKLRAIADKAGPVAEKLAPALIRVEEVFGSDLRRDPRFVEAVRGALRRLCAAGAQRTVTELGYRWAGGHL